MPDIQLLFNEIKSLQDKERELLQKAYDFAVKAHDGQMRFSGESYFNHVFETAKYLAEFGMDTPTIAAGLLHDTVEDSAIDSHTIEKEFGREIASLIEGVTKLGKLKYQGLERHVESLRKFFIATADDPRVLIIKLADRLHNVKTLDGHPSDEKRKRIALETLQIFAPLADRLGMGILKGLLEDYSFPYVYPKEFNETKELLTSRGKDHEKVIDRFHKDFKKELIEHDIKEVEISYRVKHLYSLWRKLQRYDMDIDKIYDITALRVVVPTLEDCYRILGIIHGSWHPLPGRIKDYIALPKPNGYQSLHTTIFTGNGGIVEVQIRTRQMHHDAEYGIASHLAYKQGLFERFSKRTRTVQKKLSWIQQLLEWQKADPDSHGDHYIDKLKMDFFHDRVFVFTPKGDAIDLPVGASPIDFAYSVHSDIGDHLMSAKVNGKLVHLDYELKNGEIVEVITKRNSKPSQKWLSYAKTTLAQRRIRQFLQRNKQRV